MNFGAYFSKCHQTTQHPHYPLFSSHSDPTQCEKQSAEQVTSLHAACWKGQEKNEGRYVSVRACAINSCVYFPHWLTCFLINTFKVLCRWIMSAPVWCFQGNQPRLINYGLIICSFRVIYRHFKNGLKPRDRRKNAKCCHRLLNLQIMHN